MVTKWLDSLDLRERRHCLTACAARLFYCDARIKAVLGSLRPKRDFFQGAGVPVIHSAWTCFS